MINVVIPSYKRADILKGYSYFTMAKYVIPESQKDDYLKYCSIDRLIVIPDECDGNISIKRNWILDNIEFPMVILDDDVKYIGYYEGRDGTYSRSLAKILPQDKLMDWFQRSFDLCEQLGTVLWGISINRDDRIVMEQLPISLSRVILGPFSGHLKHNIRYDVKMNLKEDYDLSLQVLNRYRKILRFNKFFYECEHGTNKGGCVAIRSFDKELQACRAISKKWGKKIIQYKENPQKPSDLLNASKINVPIKGV